MTKRTWLGVMALAAMAATPVLGAGATTGEGLTGSNFEILDGNTVVNTTAHKDWDNVGAIVKPDALSGGGDNSFVQGTKEDTAIPVIETGSIPPNKSDLKEFGSWVESSASGSFLHLFWTRVQDPSGTTNMDFEFNHNICTAANTTGCTTNGQTPTRSIDDLLITYDLSRGGTKPTISLRYWNGSAWGAAESLDATTATGSINTAGITTNINGAAGSYSARTFGEASVNLAAIFDPTKCSSFGSAYLKSRSSDSFTSALKDFISPVGVDISNCGRMVVKKTDNNGAILAGASFTVSPPNSATPPSTAMTEVATGIFCIDNLLLNTSYTAHESVVPPGYDPAPDQSFTPTTAGSCGGVTASTVPDLTFVNTPITAPISVHKQDDVGNPLLNVGFTLYQDLPPLGGTLGAEDVAVDTCTTDAAGDCSFGSQALGRYWVAETSPPSGYGLPTPQNITVTSATDVELTFVNPRQFKVITIVCQVSNGQLYASSVAYDGGAAQTSVGHVGAPGADALCTTGGAVHDNVGTGSHSAAISIP